MAIKDLAQASQTYELFNRLEIAMQNADQWTQQVMAIKTELATLPEYIANASVQDVAYADNSFTASDVFNKAVPVPPSKIIPAPEPEADPDLHVVG